MTKKFNMKVYRGKRRIYLAVPNETRISRLWVWDCKVGEYQAPPQGKCYLAKRYEVMLSKRKRVFRFFETIEEARAWQMGNNVEASSCLPNPGDKSGPLFGKVIAEWKRRCFPRIAESTRISYENMIRLYFGGLMNFTIHEITPSAVDQWLDELTDPES